MSYSRSPREKFSWYHLSDYAFGRRDYDSPDDDLCSVRYFRPQQVPWLGQRALSLFVSLESHMFASRTLLSSRAVPVFRPSLLFFSSSFAGSSADSVSLEVWRLRWPAVEKESRCEGDSHPGHRNGGEGRIVDRKERIRSQLPLPSISCCVRHV